MVDPMEQNEALEPTTIGLPHELKLRIESAAARAGRSADDMIRELLEKAIKHQPLQAPIAPGELPLELIDIIDRMYPGSGWSGAD